MWKLKGIWGRSMCVCCIAVGSLWWNRRSLHGGQCGRTLGFTVKNNNEPRTLPKQGFRDVREIACRILYILFVKVYSIQSWISVLFTIFPSVSSLKWSGWEPVEVGTMVHCAIASGALCWHYPAICPMHTTVLESHFWTRPGAWIVVLAIADFVQFHWVQMNPFICF